MIPGIAVFVGACGCHILLNPLANFVGAYGAEHWVLVDWSRSWINLDVANVVAETKVSK